MLKNLLVVLVAACVALPAMAAEEVRFWHAMNGALGQELEKLAAKFNDAQKEYRVVPAYKGSYDETLAAALAARKNGGAPHIVQVYEVGTADVMANGAVRPLWQVMADAGQPLEAKYVPAVAGYFSDANGRLLALPFNTSTPVLYYNKDAFKAAKLDPASPPKTWYEMPAVLGALRESGKECAFTTAWQSWVLLENMSAWHNQEFATHANGMAGAQARLAFNSRLMVRWISMLSSWNKSGYFTYSGRRDEAEARFAAGECAILTSSSASYAELKKHAKFDFGVAQLPYYDDFAGAPQNTLIGGAGLWVMAGQPSTRGAAKFLAFLAKPEVQAEWHQATGYVPLTTAAYELTRKQGFYAAHPGHEIAVRQLLLKNPTRDSKGIRLPAFVKIRGIIDEELEAVWASKKTPMDALNTAVARGNQVLDRAK
ncbi:MAG TPA: sn-glycerol-3-phosphate ABC transporter substrate-binding protein UgpB [Burkholderiales bacterium]|nr:sn-glycerol-3-phosphate ABC transporter substrate-binding protein UgpB [Burkholderiales bacterium]